MPAVDPLVFKILAETEQARQEMLKLTRSMDTADRSVQRLGGQVRRSSQEIGVSLQGLAGALGAAFSVRQVMQFADSFTRLQNSLRVTGLEGDALAGVQGKLLEISSKYGVSVEGLANLYGKASDAGASFGASQAQVLQLTEATSQALRITGTGAQQASGAILGLSQALASGTVRAEEFNQINEGGLRPLLQAAAATDRFRGDITKLRAAIVDGKVSSQELFNSILTGLASLAARAEKANGTLSGALETLRSNLIVYVGETDSALGASERMSGAIELLAENIDAVANSLAILTAFLGGRFVAGLVISRAALAGAAAQMGALGAAAFALQARAVGAATSMEALTFAARGFAATGVGLAVTAVAIGIGYLAAKSDDAEVASRELSASIKAQAAELDAIIQKQREADSATGKLNDSQRRALTSTANLTGEANLLANAWARVAAEAKRAALEQARAAREQALTNLKGAQSTFQAQRNAEFQRVAVRPFAERGLGASAPAINSREALRTADKALIGSSAYTDLVQATANLNAMNRRVAELEKQGLSEFRANSPAAKPDKKTGKRDTGPTADDVRRRFDDELGGYRSQIAASQASMAKSADERAELELRQVELARNATLRSLEADEHYSNAQKDRLRIAVENVADAEREAINFARRAQLEQEAEDLAQVRYDAEDEALRLQYDLADTAAERRSLAMRMLDAEDAYLRSKLQAVIASETIAEAEKERARIALEALENTSVARAERVRRDHESPLERYLSRTSDPKERAEEAAARELQAVRDGLAEGISEQLGVKNQFVKDMLSIFLDDVLFRPIADALASNRGGGILGGIIGSVGAAIGLPRFANGGSGVIGGRGGVDQNVLSLNGQPFARVSRGETLDISPNARAAGSGGITILQTVNVDASGSVNPHGYAEHIRQAVRQETVAIVASATRQTLRAVPARMASFQRDGS